MSKDDKELDAFVLSARALHAKAKRCAVAEADSAKKQEIIDRLSAMLSEAKKQNAELLTKQIKLGDRCNELTDRLRKLEDAETPAEALARTES